MLTRDLTGQKFGRLTVIAEAGRAKNRNVLWKCRCDCGKEVIVQSGNLPNGHTRSCGYCPTNTYKKSLDNTHMIIVCSRGEEFLIDTGDYEKVKPYNWFPHGGGYASTNINGKRIKLHRFLMNAPDNIQVDHINGVKRDNRRSNLRYATSRENARNVGLRSNNSSGAKGIYFEKNINKYRAQIGVRGRTIHLGSYTSLVEASEAYDRAAEKYFGEFAWLNNLREKTSEINADVFPFAAK